LPSGKPEIGINARYIEYLHDSGIALTWPGLEPVKEYDCLDLNLLASAAVQPFQAGFGVEFYPTLFDKAACYFFLIAGGHIFGNGNKRTAVLVIDQFMWANAHYLNIPNDKIRKIAEETASYKLRDADHKDVISNLSILIRENSFPFKSIRKSRPKQYRSFHRVKNLVRETLELTAKRPPKQSMRQLGATP
jgi:prophage maintenance system killer protein